MIIRIKKRTKLLMAALLIAVVLAFLYYNKDEREVKNILHNNLLEQAFESELEQAAKIPPSYWDQKYKNIPIKNKYKIVFVATRGGEYNYAKTFQYSANKLGWDVRVYPDQIKTYDHEILSFDPDFILYSIGADHYITPELLAHRSRKYLNNHSSIRALVSWWGDPGNRPSSSEVDDRTRALVSPFHAILNVPQELEVFRKIFERNNKIFNGIAVQPYTPRLINEPATPKFLTWCGMGWDKFRSSDQYKKFIKRLSENVPMKVYGPYSYLSYLAPKVYDGYTGSGMEQIDAIRANGIYLLTHSDHYLKAEIPTSRIFEALAANVVIISDMHPFVIKNFGNNILYFDQNADADTMYNQVKKHVDWILANPKEAKLMAERAHQIFLEKYTVEQDFYRIARMHEYILQQEKEMGLKYPLTY